MRATSRHDVAAYGRPACQPDTRPAYACLDAVARVFGDARRPPAPRPPRD